MILDGPVDTLWIESMNSVLDDSKLLTLNNGDRIALTGNVRMLFEVQDLAVASPATVSRAGMVFMDIDELGWQPFAEVWVRGKLAEAQANNIKHINKDYCDFLLDQCVYKYIPKILKCKKDHCQEMVKTSDVSQVRNLCKLFDALCNHLKRGDDEDVDSFMTYIEKMFVFCLIWSIGASVEEGSRREIDNVLRDIEPMFPHASTVFELYMNPDKKDWGNWNEKVLPTWRPQGKEFHEIIVPTVDTVRNKFVLQTLLDAKLQALFVGNSGVGKTVLIDSALTMLTTNELSFTINMSAGTTASYT